MKRKFEKRQLMWSRLIKKILPKTTGLILLAYWAPAVVLLVIARYFGDPHEVYGVVCLATGYFLAVCGSGLVCAFFVGHSFRGLTFLKFYYVPDWVPLALIIVGSIVGILIGALFFPFLDRHHDYGLFIFGSLLILFFFFLVPAVGFMLVGAKKKQKQIRSM